MSGARLIIERPWSDLEALRRSVTPAEWDYACRFGSERRQREFLTWRAIIRRELGPGVQIGYNAVGAPVVTIDPIVLHGTPVFSNTHVVSDAHEVTNARIVADAHAVPDARIVPGDAWQIGVSHCDGYVAVCLSERRCAVDIERLDRNFERVTSHYLTDCERSMLTQPWWLAVAWCAKETLYKYSGRRELELLRDLRIERVDPRTCRIVGRIAGGEPVELTWQLLERAAVVFIL